MRLSRDGAVGEGIPILIDHVRPLIVSRDGDRSQHRRRRYAYIHSAPAASGDHAMPAQVTDRM
jgi:hypothetical protein